jgi:hypothetical protein
LYGACTPTTRPNNVSTVTDAAPQAAPEPAVAAPQAVPDSPAPAGLAVTPLRAQLSRSASAMGNRAFTSWARGAGAAGEPLPTSSARELWGQPVLAREGEAAPTAEAEDEDKEEPIDVKGLKFGKDTLDGVLPEKGGDLSKTFQTHFDKNAKFGPYSLQVPLLPPVITAGFGAGGAMSAKAYATLTLSGKNILGAVSGRAKKQEVSASGQGSAQGTIAASMVAGVKFGVAGLANVGIFGQGTLAFRATGDASFDGSIKRFKPKGEKAWLPWSGAINFNAKIKGSLIAEAKGYFEYQVLWIFRDQFGKFRIGQWTLAEAGLNVTGSMGPGKPMKFDIQPWVGELMTPGVSQELRARTKSERELAEKLASAGAAGDPLARKVARLARAVDPPPPGGGDDDEQPGAGGAAPAPAAAEPAPAGGEAVPAGGEAAPAGPQGEGGGAAPGAAAPGAGANADLAAIAGVTPAPPVAGAAGGGVLVIEAEPKIEE